VRGSMIPGRSTGRMERKHPPPLKQLRSVGDVLYKSTPLSIADGAKGVMV
jgi:hypothetical protein